MKKLNIIYIILLLSFASDSYAIKNCYGISDTKLAKECFINHVRPLIQSENKQILEIRDFITKIQQSNTALNTHINKKLSLIAKTYQVKLDKNKIQESLNELLHKIDIIPEKIAIAQAALESGWGKSRFAYEANNLYGQWCYSKNCGIIPKNRDKHAKHEVKFFNNIKDSIKAYMLNLNTHYAYGNFRKERALQRDASNLNALSLIKHLTKYSQIPHEYEKRLKKIIVYNNL